MLRLNDNWLRMTDQPNQIGLICVGVYVYVWVWLWVEFGKREQCFSFTCFWRSRIYSFVSLQMDNDNDVHILWSNSLAFVDTEQRRLGDSPATSHVNKSGKQKRKNWWLFGFVDYSLDWMVGGLCPVFFFIFSLPIDLCLYSAHGVLSGFACFVWFFLDWRSVISFPFNRAIFPYFSGRYWRWI